MAVKFPSMSMETIFKVNLTVLIRYLYDIIHQVYVYYV